MPAAGSSSKLWAGQASQLGVRGPAAAQGSCRTHVSGVTVVPGSSRVDVKGQRGKNYRLGG